MTPACIQAAISQARIEVECRLRWVSMETSEKPDFGKGISIDSIPDDGKLVGVVEGEDVLLVRREAEFFAVGASCTHYHGPLAEGLFVGDEVRCPWHHACFSLRTGEMLRRKGYAGPLIMISADSAPPCDRPNLSKDFLAGTAPAEWIPLRPPEWYNEHKIELVLNTR